MVGAKTINTILEYCLARTMWEWELRRLVAEVVYKSVVMAQNKADNHRSMKDLVGEMVGATISNGDFLDNEVRDEPWRWGLQTNGGGQARGSTRWTTRKGRN